MIKGLGCLAPFLAIVSDEYLPVFLSPTSPPSSVTQLNWWPALVSSSYFSAVTLPQAYSVHRSGLVCDKHVMSLHENAMCVYLSYFEEGRGGLHLYFPAWGRSTGVFLLTD